MRSLNINFKNIALPLFSALLIPLSPAELWTPYQFNNIKANEVKFSPQTVTINVDHSASPLIYSLKEPIEITSIAIAAHLKGFPQAIPSNKTQGSKGYDDFVLRFGLITKGNERLNWLQRQMAPEWLLAMERKLPKGSGIRKVLFFTTCRQESLLKKVRSHFLSSILSEECVTLLRGEGDFTISKKLEEAQTVLGFWASTDGDDLSSYFSLEIKKIQVNYNKTTL